MHTHGTTPRLAAALALVIALCLPAPALAQANCTFTGGFKILRDQIPDVVGACLEAEHFDAQLAEDGAGTMQRTTGGTLRWREHGNWVGFTNATTTWTIRVIPNLETGIDSPPTLISGQNAINEGLTSRLSLRCSTVSSKYSRIIRTTYGESSTPEESRDAIFQWCADFARIASDHGVTCFDTTMQGMLDDIPAYGQDKNLLAERMEQRIQACLAPQS